MKKNKDLINFTINNGRIFSDSMDTYYWLRLRNKKIADEFWSKEEFIRRYFIKKEKEAETAKTAMIGKMEWGEPEKVEKWKGKIIKTWWKRLFIK